MTPTLERFSKFIHETDPDLCWEWQSHRSRTGYGAFWLNGGTRSAHRTSYLLHNGPIPPGLHVRHTCDNPPCVNPRHLILGTRKDNAGDALERGRYRRGAANGRAKLTTEQVAEIFRRYHETHERQVDLAEEYSVSQSLISNIVRGATWLHLGLKAAS